MTTVVRIKCLLGWVCMLTSSFVYAHFVDSLPPLFEHKDYSKRYFVQPNDFYLLASNKENPFASVILPGAERMHLYLPLLQGKRVAIFSNQTSIVRTNDERRYIHLIDTLLRLGIQVRKVLIPEHGLMGFADAGETVQGGYDDVFDIEVISLYGARKMPTEKDLSGIDVLIFDIQDVGVRFYTYISSLQYLMEAAIQYKLTFLLLDRPNPNGFYVDGPVLQDAYKSFIGLQKIPIVYGMTILEYAQMLYLEGLLNEHHYTMAPNLSSNTEANDKKFSFVVVPCKNYTHHSRYQLSIKPSPNLGSMQAIYLYPSLCLLEGTKASLGRGTSKPFELYGYPEYPSENAFSFTPLSKVGAKAPPYLNQKCYGRDLSMLSIDSLFQASQGSLLTLQWLMNAYGNYPNKKNFFDTFFFKQLVGNADLEKQIMTKESQEKIKAGWKDDLNRFLRLRKRYVLYEDF